MSYGDRYEGRDGSELKVIQYEDKIVVHTKDSDGNPDGHVTSWYDNPDVHVHDKDGDRWE